MTTIHGEFSRTADRYPDRVALRGVDGVLTYAELRDWMNAVAATLPEVGPDDVVGLCTGRSFTTIAGMLGILRAGGAYLPLDPGMPDARLTWLAGNSGVRVVLADPSRADRVRALVPDGVRVVVIDPPPGPLGDPPADAGSTGSHLAYLLYTSGSTGVPKGVMVEQRGVVELARDPFSGTSPGDVFCQLAPLHADPSAFEIWTPLLNGASLVVPGEGELSVHEIGELLVRHEVTVLRLVAPLFALVVESDLAALRGLRLLISGGDRASERAVRQALAGLPGCTVVNGYGPTEATVLALVHPMTAYDTSWPSVPIGRPLAGVTAHVLDERGDPADEGELWLGGSRLARGYGNDPGLTARRFVPLPGSGEPAYRSGDRVRRLPDGNLVFLGRLDHQVKIRGFRVEPGEVETALTGHPSVAEAAVVARSGRLEAFVRTSQDTSEDDLGAYLAQRLPHYLVPSVIERVDAFPRLSNGKLDRNALASGSADADHRAPVTELGRRLAEIWSAALGGRRVGLDDSFLGLGGHSLAAMDVAAKVAGRLGVRLTLPAVLEAATLAEFVTMVEAATAADPPSPPGRTGRNRAPLTVGQEGVWFDDQRAASANYTIARTFDLRGALDESALRAALRRLARRQRALTTVVESGPDGLYQVTDAERGPDIRRSDLTGLPPRQQENQIRAVVDEATAEPFDLTAGPPMRVLLVALGADRWILHLTLHHLVADDWSLDILFAELSECYRAELDGTDPVLPAVGFQYTDHASAERVTGAEVAERGLPAWRRALRDYPGMLDIPTDHPAPEELSGRGDRVRFELEGELTASLAELAEEHRVSRFMVALTAGYLLLSKYGQRRDMCVSTPVARRDHAGITDLIGYFVNMAPICLSPGEGRTVPELLDRVRTACLDAYRRADIPFPTLARELDRPVEGGRNPLLQIVFAYQQHPPRELALSGVAATPWEQGTGTAKFDLGFSFEERSGCLAGVIEFSTDLFDRPTIERLAGHLVNVFRWLARNPAGDPRTLTLLGAEEERIVREEWNRTEIDVPLDRCLHELVSLQAGTRPDKVAVVGPDETMTYGELEARSDRLAAHLVRAGVRVEDRVAVCLERSARLLVAILGVLKAGGAYVPLDPAYPAERLRHLEADSSATVLITSADLRRSLFQVEDGIVVDIDEPMPEQAAPLAEPPRPDNLACLIYTSGSTGVPKGVAIEHRSLVNVFYGHLRWYSFDETDRWSQFAATGFDMALYEQFMPLLTGATSVIATEEERMDGRLFVDFVDRNRITVQVSSPAFLRSLGQPELPTVRVLITGGEVANLPDVAYYAPRKAFLNCYGPTEVTVCTTSYRATGAETSPRLPIGGPQPNTKLYIVDDDGQLCPIGVPGEIYIGGMGLSRGYWGDPGLTGQRFGTVPALGAEPLYRTGDRARWMPDGNVDFLGRLDSYVKIRGYRVELGEIEAVLIAHPDVAHAAVIVRDQALVAFVVGDVDPARLRARLAEWLPYYLIPGRFVSIDRMPMTAHVKVDRRALAAMVADAEPAAATGSPTERRVTEIWLDVLGLPSAAAGQDFFASGGHSLLIARLLDRLETDLGARVGVRDFLAEPTIQGLASRIDGAEAEPDLVPSADAELEADLDFRPVPRPPGDPHAVLLTGVTGFLGAFLLRELLERVTGVVYCLIRAGSEEKAHKRILDTVDAYRLDVTPDDLARVRAVPGDLADAGLGLDSGTWRELAGEVELIVHAGAHVHHLTPYARLKTANVSGTADLLRLAAQGRPKRFHHVSSLSVFTEESGRVITETTAADREQHPSSRGYSASKWVSDRMVGLAIDRGLDGRIHRIGRIAGDSRHGVVNTDDMFCRLLVSCAVLGCYPRDERLDTSLLPVDVVARALVTLALDGDPADDASASYHLHHPDPVGLASFLAVLEKMEDTAFPAVLLAEWVERAKRFAELPIQPYLPTLLELSRSQERRIPARYANEVTRRRLDFLGVAIPDINEALIERYWRFLKKGGHLR
nr:non-ribosomal peptide synthetase [Kibdelosporangium sp. MJ126-NF4]CEL13236.1 Non-ribosomal peptide synthetase [Kibdelosporangium sp. MJ126-NF4]CTQ98927.1 Non-ribosomal peptide synthetase [Kibdelosporangium sp. MJ126-NF4]